MDQANELSVKYNCIIISAFTLGHLVNYNLVHWYEHINVHICRCVHTHRHACSHACTCRHTHMHAHKHTHKHTRTHTHTQTQTQTLFFLFIDSSFPFNFYCSFIVVSYFISFFSSFCVVFPFCVLVAWSWIKKHCCTLTECTIEM